MLVDHGDLRYGHRSYRHQNGQPVFQVSIDSPPSPQSITVPRLNIYYHHLRSPAYVGFNGRIIATDRPIHL